MEFCDKCDGLLIPQDGKTVCRNCGKVKKLKSSKDFKLSSTIKKAEPIIVVDKKSSKEVLPKQNVECPKCSNKEAYWWTQQTRSADEPPTRFFRCTNCEHTWREYE